MCEFLSIVLLNHGTGLTPAELIAVQQSIDGDDDVHDWGGEEIDEEANDESDAIDASGWQPGHDEEGV
jgi:hypothetical protein